MLLSEGALIQAAPQVGFSHSHLPPPLYCLVLRGTGVHCPVLPCYCLLLPCTLLFWAFMCSPGLGFGGLGLGLGVRVISIFVRPAPGSDGVSGPGISGLGFRGATPKYTSSHHFVTEHHLSLLCYCLTKPPHVVVETR